MFSFSGQVSSANRPEQIGYWYLGRPGFEVHERFQGVYSAVLNMKKPQISEEKIDELVGRFNGSIENWRKKHSRPELKVSVVVLN